MSTPSVEYRAAIYHWACQLSVSQLQEALTVAIHADEWPLLHDMVTRYHCPPLTPIHPRALGFSHEASTAKYTDGRNGIQRQKYARRTQPRLFQWIVTEGALVDTIDTASLKKKKRGRKSPSQGNKSTHIHVDVLARQWVAPWGERWSVGCTQSQRDTDEHILQCTQLIASLHTGEHDTYYLHWRNSNDTTAHHIMRILHIASRGNLFTSKHSSSAFLFLPEWIQVTQRWFSLSMYLASRYDIALRDAYERSRTHPALSIRPAPLERVQIDALSPLQQQILVSKVMCAVVKECMLFKNVKTAVSTLRDSLVWKLLIDIPECGTAVVPLFSHNINSISRDTHRHKSLYQSLTECCITHWDTPLFVLQRSMCHQMHHSLSEWNAQQLLLADSTPLSSHPPLRTIHRTNTTSNKKKAKTGKKGRKKDWTDFRSCSYRS
jgi:hypothetical protein